MEKAKEWLHSHVRGTERTGVLITKESARYKPLGIHVLASGDENAVLPEWTLILHGDEDVTVQLPASFWADIALFTLSLTDMNALGFIARNQGTPCEAVEMK